jgi:hypothetical protein
MPSLTRAAGCEEREPDTIPATHQACAIAARPSNFASSFALLLAVLLLPPWVGLAQRKSDLSPPPPLSPAEGERLARTLLTNLLALKPDQDSTNTGLLKIRDARGQQREMPLRLGILTTPTNWLSVYEAVGTGEAPGAALTITHRDREPSRYLLSQSALPGAALAGPDMLTGNQLMLPFAGSDFWIADLGLEFLYWPQQRVLKKQMRSSLFCDVLQSLNPQPAPGAYSRVVTWIAINRPDDIVIVHADAYDSNDKLLKEFDPRKLKRINGYYQPKVLEIRNVQTDSSTRIEFDFNP